MELYVYRYVKCYIFLCFNWGQLFQDKNSVPHSIINQLGYIFFSIENWAYKFPDPTKTTYKVHWADLKRKNGLSTEI